ncbi:hypothetical protein DFP73DRAFT_208655 [Morchella snyderi]|nr:hypothetical protein DFP73DRAFT_208655 [Morchella snyderi]
MANPEEDKCAQSDSQSLFPVTACPALPTQQPDIVSLVASSKTSSRTALITYYSPEILLFSSPLLEPKAINSAYDHSSLHNLEEPIPPHRQLELPIPPQDQAPLQHPSAISKAAGRYTAAVVLATIILLIISVFRQQSTIRALRKWMGILMLWVQRLNPDAGHGMRIVNRTSLTQEKEGIEEEKLRPIFTGPAEPYVSGFGGEALIPDGSEGVAETDPISPLELDESPSATTEDPRATSQAAEESQLSGVSDRETSSQYGNGERIDISTWPSVDTDSFNDTHSAPVFVEEESEAPKDQHILSPVFQSPLESNKSAIVTSLISDEENNYTDICCILSVSSEEEYHELDSEEEVPRDIIEYQDSELKDDNENAVQEKSENSLLPLLEDIDLEVEDASGEVYHDGGKVSQSSITKDEPLRAEDVSLPGTPGETFSHGEDTSLPGTVGEIFPHAEDASPPGTVRETSPRAEGSSPYGTVEETPPHTEDPSPPGTVGETFPHAEDAISLPCSGGLNDGDETSDSIEEEAPSATPADTELTNPQRNKNKIDVNVRTPDVDDLVSLMSSWHLRSPVSD